MGLFFLDETTKTFVIRKSSINPLARFILVAEVRRRVLSLLRLTYNSRKQVYDMLKLKKIREKSVLKS